MIVGYPSRNELGFILKLGLEKLEIEKELLRIFFRVGGCVRKRQKSWSCMSSRLALAWAGECESRQEAAGVT